MLFFQYNQIFWQLLLLWMQLACQHQNSWFSKIKWW
jgi:hypothetical protein